MEEKNKILNKENLYKKLNIHESCPLTCFEHKYKTDNNKYSFKKIAKKHYIIILILLSILILFLYFSIKYREVYLELIILFTLGIISTYIGFFRPENIRIKTLNAAVKTDK